VFTVSDFLKQIRIIKMFLNFDVNTGLSISQKPTSTVGDIGDLAVTYQNRDGNISCPLDGAKDTLEDGSFWNGYDATQETLEMIHSFITENE
jgi:hypothetical protein